MNITCVLDFALTGGRNCPQPEIFNLQFDWSSWTISISIYKSELLFPLRAIVKCIFAEPPVF